MAGVQQQQQSSSYFSSLFRVLQDQVDNVKVGLASVSDRVVAMEKHIVVGAQTVASSIAAKLNELAGAFDGANNAGSGDDGSSKSGDMFPKAHLRLMDKLRREHAGAYKRILLLAKQPATEHKPEAIDAVVALVKR